MTRPALSHLSDRELLTNLLALTRRERETTLDVLLHLIEVETRKLHLKQGHGSLFDYCVKRLRYSESAAGRRIQTARAVQRFPEIGDLLLAGEVNLMSITLIAGLLTEENKTDLLSGIRGRSRREVETIVAHHRPQPVVPDRVRPVCIRLPEPASGRLTGSTPTGGSESASSTAAAAAPPSPRMVQKHLIQFAAGDDFMKKLEEMRSLLSAKFPAASLEQVLGAAMDAYLDKHHPARRTHRTSSNRSDKPSRTGSDSRYITPAVRDEVFTRDGGTCTYKGTDGRRCQSRHNAQVDHVIPFARGGPNDASNLRLLCGKHNRLEAERVYGFALEPRFRRTTRDPGRG